MLQDYIRVVNAQPYEVKSIIVAYSLRRLYLDSITNTKQRKNSGNPVHSYIRRRNCINWVKFEHVIEYACFLPEVILNSDITIMIRPGISIVSQFLSGDFERIVLGWCGYLSVRRVTLEYVHQPNINEMMRRLVDRFDTLDFIPELIVPIDNRPEACMFEKFVLKIPQKVNTLSQIREKDFGLLIRNIDKFTNLKTLFIDSDSKFMASQDLSIFEYLLTKLDKLVFVIYKDLFLFYNTKKRIAEWKSLKDKLGDKIFFTTKNLAQKSYTTFGVHSEGLYTFDQVQLNKIPDLFFSVSLDFDIEKLVSQLDSFNSLSIKVSCPSALVFRSNTLKVLRINCERSAKLLDLSNLHRLETLELSSSYLNLQIFASIPLNVTALRISAALSDNRGPKSYVVPKYVRYFSCNATSFNQFDLSNCDHLETLDLNVDTGSSVIDESNAIWKSIPDAVLQNLVLTIIPVSLNKRQILPGMESCNNSQESIKILGISIPEKFKTLKLTIELDSLSFIDSIKDYVSVNFYEIGSVDRFESTNFAHVDVFLSKDTKLKFENREQILTTFKCHELLSVDGIKAYWTEKLQKQIDNIYLLD